MPIENAQGAYNFLSLTTGARNFRDNWPLLPLTDTAIACVEALALHDGQSLVQDRGLLVVAWHPDHPIDDSEYDGDYDEPLLDFDPIDPDELAGLAVPDIAPEADPYPLNQGAHNHENDHDNDKHGYHEPLVSDDDNDLDKTYADDADGTANNPRDDIGAIKRTSNAYQDAYDGHGNPEDAEGHTDNDATDIQPDDRVEPTKEAHA